MARKPAPLILDSRSRAITTSDCSCSRTANIRKASVSNSLEESKRAPVLPTSQASVSEVLSDIVLTLYQFKPFLLFDQTSFSAIAIDNESAKTLVKESDLDRIGLPDSSSSTVMPISISLLNKYIDRLLASDFPPVLIHIFNSKSQSVEKYVYLMATFSPSSLKPDINIGGVLLDISQRGFTKPSTATPPPLTLCVDMLGNAKAPCTCVVVKYLSTGPCPNHLCPNHCPDFPWARKEELMRFLLRGRGALDPRPISEITPGKVLI